MLNSAKTVAEADPEVSEAIDFARYYAHTLDLGEEGRRAISLLYDSYQKTTGTAGSSESLFYSEEESSE